MNYRHIILKFLRFLPVEKAGAVTSKKSKPVQPHRWRLRIFLETQFEL